MARADKDRIAAKLRAILIDARTDADLTQKALAARLKRPQSFVSNYERGAGRVDVADFILIAEALKLEPTALLKRLY
jgi:transcriptional regulator with XRE-family HTH domain